LSSSFIFPLGDHIHVLAGNPSVYVVAMLDILRSEINEDYLKEYVEQMEDLDDFEEHNIVIFHTCVRNHLKSSPIRKTKFNEPGSRVRGLRRPMGTEFVEHLKNEAKK